MCNISYMSLQQAPNKHNENDGLTCFYAGNIWLSSSHNGNDNLTCFYTGNTVSPVRTTEMLVLPIFIWEIYVSPVRTAEMVVLPVFIREVYISSVRTIEMLVLPVFIREINVSPVRTTEMVVLPVLYGKYMSLLSHNRSGLTCFIRETYASSVRTTEMVVLLVLYGNICLSRSYNGNCGSTCFYMGNICTGKIYMYVSSVRTTEMMVLPVSIREIYVCPASLVILPIFDMENICISCSHNRNGGPTSFFLFVFFYVGNIFLAHKIRKSWILSSDSNSYPTQIILSAMR